MAVRAGVCAGVVAMAVLGAGGVAAATGEDGGHGKGKDRRPGYSMTTDGVFAKKKSATTAYTYDKKLVPAGSWIQVGQRTAPGGATTVSLRVKGLKAGHEYGVHVHTKPCTADPAAAGGHYQHKPSTDPAAVNPRNEVWLDFTADRKGSGKASAHHDWGFRKSGAASVVIHDKPGSSGARVGCFTVPFGWTTAR
ncbi:superoxide dismutase family protein [Streptomyces sp. UH6]|uniref:superoxide dismutase family protein n=1 Tax=Streptomyces sp. UH6 TaxID=2748379 RepID=UPI0015D46D70|nr:superoxide dismutase family protein [Streptomyces sp. UH6]NYV78607.1 superoxide dismutase family protein [Streptomyces sp. UH6]